MIDHPLPWLERLLLALFRGADADVIQGDLLERAHRVPRRAFLLDITMSLLAWWHPAAIRRRTRGRRHAAVTRSSRRPMLGTLVPDLRYAFRTLSRRPGFTAIVLATLGLGIGATTTIYSVVDAVVVRPLPYAESDRLLAVGNLFPGREWADQEAGLQQLAGVSLKNFLDWRARSHTLVALGGVEVVSALLPDLGAGPELVPMARVTEGLFSLLRVPPALGRTFLQEDHAGAGSTLVILSHGAWQERYGGDPAVVGTTLATAGTAYTIVGVLPQTFVQPAMLGSTRIDLWTPLDPANQRYASRERRSLLVFGRLAEGATVESARAELAEIQHRLGDEYPEGNVYPNGDRLGAGVNSLHADTVGSSRRTLLIFFGASAMLLVIAGLNAAHLLLVRGLDRLGEMGIRRSLGADRLRLTRELLTESVLLALGGGVVGLGIAYAGVQAFLSLAPSSLPRLGEVSVNLRIILVSTGLSLGAGLLVGLVPAIRLTGRDLATTIKQQLGTTLAPGGSRLRTVLVTTQLALAMVLVVGASLLFHSFLRITTVRPGIVAEGMSSFSMPMKRPGSPPGEATWQAWDGLLEEVRGVPGLSGVAATSVLPFASPQWAPRVLLPGEPDDQRRDGVSGYVVTPGYFMVAGTRLVAGREFEAADGPGALPVTVVNETFVEQHLRGLNPLATTLRFSLEGGGFEEARIVGVVETMVQTRAEEGAQPAVYRPYTQVEWPEATVVTRSDRDFAVLGPELRLAAARFSPVMPLRNLGSMPNRIAAVQTAPRFQAILLASFAAVALLLASVGLYGALAHMVGRRTREMGIRMALGAPRSGIFRMVLHQGLLVATVGLGVGVGVAVALTRFLQGFLYGVGALDLVSFAGALLVLAVAAVVAIMVPARRATAVDIVESLRAE